MLVLFVFWNSAARFGIVRYNCSLGFYTHHISTTQVALTAHIVRDTHLLDDNFLHKLAKDLKEKYRIIHPTIQIESGSDNEACELAHEHSI